MVEDTIPDQALVLNAPKGLVVITGCGHAGLINILTFSREQFPIEPVQAVVGGLLPVFFGDTHSPSIGPRVSEH